MQLDLFRTICLEFDNVTEGMPFGPDVLVFKVHGKMFSLCGIDSDPLSINLKGNPEYNLELRDQYPLNITPGYHMNKVHWNTVLINQSIPQALVIQLIRDSYALVRSSLPKKLRDQN